MDRTQLWQAIKSGDLALVKELIKQGVDINSPDVDSVNALQVAKTGDSQAFKPRLNSGDYVKREELTLHNQDQHNGLKMKEKEKDVSDEK